MYSPEDIMKFWGAMRGSAASAPGPDVSPDAVMGAYGAERAPAQEPRTVDASEDIVNKVANIAETPPNTGAPDAGPEAVDLEDMAKKSGMRPPDIAARNTAGPQMFQVHRGARDIDTRTAREKELVGERTADAQQASEDAYFARQAAMGNRMAALDQQAEQAKADESRMLAHQANFQKEAQEREVEMTKEIDALANSKVDTNQAWDAKSGLQKLAAFINVAARGFAGKDPMADVNNEIERSIRAQKANFQLKSQALGAKQNAFGRMMQRYGSEEAADAALRASHWRQVQNMMAKADVQAMGAEAIERKASMLDQAKALEQQSIQRGVKHQMASTRTMVSTPYGPMSLAAWQKHQMGRDDKVQDAALKTAGAIAVEDAKNKAKGAAGADERTVMVGLANGTRTPVLASSKEEARALRDQEMSTQQIEAKANKAAQIIEDIQGLKYKNPLEIKRKLNELKQLNASLMLKAKDWNKLGALSGSDIELQEGEIGKVGVTTMGSSQMLRDFAKNARSGMESRYSTLAGSQGAAIGAAPASFKEGK